MEIVEFILRDTAWLVGILVGITTLIKNIKDLKGDKNKKRRSPGKKKRRK
ncbi:hypothetical protein [Bacillus velezensis]|nr:hypothetical protein [Bacillus velezensis]